MGLVFFDCAGNGDFQGCPLHSFLHYYDQRVEGDIACFFFCLLFMFYLLLCAGVSATYTVVGMSDFEECVIFCNEGIMRECLVYDCVNAFLDHKCMENS